MSGAAVRRVQSLRTLPWPKEVRTDGGIVALRFWIATFSSSRETLAHATKQSIEPSDQIMGHQEVIYLRVHFSGYGICQISGHDFRVTDRPVTDDPVGCYATTDLESREWSDDENGIAAI